MALGLKTRPRKRRRFVALRQRDMTECGTTCLAMVLQHHGLYNVQPYLRDLAHVGTDGTDLYTLAELGEQFGFETDGYQLGYDTLRELPAPLIAHYDGNHFVVVVEAQEDRVLIADPAFGKDWQPRAEFEARWSGIALTFTPTADVFQNPDLMDLLEERRERHKQVRRGFYTDLLRPFKSVLGEIVAASFALQLLALALPFFTQLIIDQVLVYQDQRLLYVILIGMVFILLVQILLTYVRNLLLTQFKVRFELDFFSGFFRHFLHLKQGYFDAYKREDFINRFQENLKLRKALAPSVMQAFIDLIFVVNAVIVLFFYNFWLALNALGFIAFFAVMMVLFSPRLRALEDKIFAENLRTMGAFLDTLLGMLTVKLLGLERMKFWEWKNKYKRALNKVLRTEQTHIQLQSILKSAYFLSQISVYWIGAYLAFNGAMTIGAYIAFIAIFTIAMNALDNVSSLWFLATELSVTYARVNDVLVQEPERRDRLEQHAIIERPRIELRNVSFSYTDPDAKTLRDLDVVIEPGERIALLGRNGSGKSTLAKLLVGLYDHYEGSIQVGDVELRRIHPHVLRQKVTLVPQDVYLFSGTIRDNIRYGNPQATMEEVVAAAKRADAHEWIKGLYLGYNYMVGESGSNLSGGQRLKIAFARLFLQKPEVIILDEASSALDLEAERRIMESVYTHFADATIISIAHRLQTLRHADRVLVLDGGQIVEEGSHDELMRREGTYYALMNAYLSF